MSEQIKLASSLLFGPIGFKLIGACSLTIR